MERVASGAGGAPIHAVTLRDGDLRARVLTLGAALWDLRLSGVAHPLILGHAEAAAYLDNDARFGVVVGRVANRIANGRAVVAGRVAALNRNEATGHTLHGGEDGSGRRLWRITGRDAGSVTLCDTLPDGHMGFPGAVFVQVRYGLRGGALGGGALRIEITARTDAPTLCNFAPHIYFNLSGAADISDHILRVDADSAIPIAAGIPTGPPAPVGGALPDLRRAGRVPVGMDLNYCTGDAAQALRGVAELSAGDVAMRLFTTEPGLQVYDASGLMPCAGLERRVYGARAGLALEPQRWIDAPNRAWRGQVDLRPSQTYRHVSAFRFSLACAAPAG